MKNEKTHHDVASEASELLRSDRTSAEVKSVAGSALTQAPDHNKRNEHEHDHNSHHGNHHNMNKKTTC